MLSLFTLLFVLTATPAFADIFQGRVVDPANRVVPGATVLVMHGPTIVATVTADREGAFGPVRLEPGPYDIAVAAPGFRLPPTTMTITAAGETTMTLKLALDAIGDSVVVSASQVETPSSRVPDAVTVVGAQTIAQQQIVGVADALRMVPGFGVVASGGAGALTSLFPRGGESDYTLVLVDGIEQNAFGGGFDAAHLDTADVERIEVVRGPQSALYGAGAIGGIVHVITAHGGPLRGTARVEGGSYGTTSSSGSVAGSLGALTFGGGLDWLHSDGDRSTRASVGGPVSNDDYERVSGTGSIGWSDRASRRVRADVKLGRNERGFPGPIGRDPGHSFFGLDTISRGINKTKAVGGSATFAQGASIFHQAQVNWAGETGDFASPFGPSSDQTHRATARYEFDIEQSRMGVTAGAEWLRERANNSFITDATFTAIPVTRNDSGLFVEARPNLGGRVVANLGVRVERLERTTLEGDGFRPAFDPQVVWSTNPKIALAWFPRADQTANGGVLGWTKVRFGAGTGIKAPTAFDIGFTDNPNLKPERSRSVDVGIEQEVASKVVLDATFFHNRYDDLIVTVGSALAGASKYRTDNIANARAQGLEVGGAWQPASSLSVHGAWTWLDTEVLGTDHLPELAPRPFTVGQRLVRRPRSSGSVDVTWARARGNAFVAVNGRGSMLDLDPSTGSSVFEADGYVTTAFGGTVQIVRGVSVYGRITNAFDRQYEETLGYPARGRSGFIGIRVTGSH